MILHFQMSMVLAALLVGTSSPQCLTDNDTMLRLNEHSRQQLIQSQLMFSTDLLRFLVPQNATDNVFFSPSSVFNALLLAYFASAKQTEKALKKTLHLPEDMDKVNTFGAYILEKYYQELRIIKNADHYRLTNTNRMYVTDKQKIRPCIKKHFKEEVESADFVKNPTATVNHINEWVSQKTRNNIKEVLTPDSINSNTNLVLVNAAYFKGIWKTQFSPTDTAEADFILSNGTAVPVMMMNADSKFVHIFDDDVGLDILEMPYEGEDISMFILLPVNSTENAVSDVVAKLSADIVEDIVNRSMNASRGEVSVSIPKFSFDQSLELTPVLQSMGVGDLFENTADLSSLTGKPLKLDTVVHKSKIKVDETGTEAAAATAVFANRFAADVFQADHPFIYFLFNKKSKTLLFVGVFNSPDTNKS